MLFRKSQFVFYTCLSFVLGIGIASFILIPNFYLYIFFLLSLVILILSSSKSLLQLIGLSCIFLILGIYRYNISIPNIDEDYLAYYNNASESKYSERSRITFQGIIIDEPDTRSDHIKYKVEGIDKKGRVLVKNGLFPKYNYGDVLEINCALQEVEPIEDFRYDKYLALTGVRSLCYRGYINLIDENQGNLFKASIFKLKDKVVKTSSQILPEPQASFLGGLLWGAKKGMPPDILENFNRTGVTHIIAVSGYNITIIAVMLTNLFISLGISRKKAFILILLGIIFFVIITGSPASIVRAGIMGVIALISTTIGRATSMNNILVLVCLIMLSFNPLVLIWDAGFQLSFLATIGLVYFVPIIERYFKYLPNVLEIRDSLSTTMAAIILTTPLILFQFKRFSFLAPIANLLILPIIPINMAVGFLGVVLGMIYVPLGKVIGYLSWIILTYVLKLTEILSKVTWASVEIGNFHWSFMLLSYLLIFILIIRHE
ncbi:ComEC/Rec2 family competence protein, partial [bacterium]|nr:ComEC/Rec2 family competence protein [bacterium]